MILFTIIFTWKYYSGKESRDFTRKERVTTYFRLKDVNSGEKLHVKVNDDEILITININNCLFVTDFVE